MNKFTILLLLLISFKSFAQTIDNVQLLFPPGPVLGSTPNDPAAYVWTEYSNVTQGVNIHLIKSEKKEVFLQQNNHKLAFNTLGSATFLYKVEIKYDEEDWIEIFNSEDNDDVSATQSVGWISTPTNFNSIGNHTLQVKYYNQSPSSPFLREYVVRVIPPSQGFFRDGTQLSDPSFTSGNTLTLWDHPTMSDAKPILISEGYDASNDFFAELYRHRGDYLSERLFELGYKIYVLNYNLANQSMKNNAAVLNSAINYLSFSHNNEDIGLIGVSMGGVISRYALADSEGMGNPLPVSFFASFDAPQQGAVVDANFLDFIDEKVDDFPPLGNDAAKELLIYNPFDTQGNMNSNFYAELNNLNGSGYPTSIPTIGVAFSNESINPGKDSIWETVVESYGSNIPLKKTEFFVSDAWAAGGSYFPTSATNIAPQYGVLPVPALFQGQFERKNLIANPTFIPHHSALDLVDGKSKFCYSIKTDITERFYFHDELPNSTIDGFIGVVSGFDLHEIEENETYNFTSKVAHFVVNDLDVKGRMFINKNSFSGSSFNPKDAEPLPKFNVRTSACKSVDITVFSNAELRMGDGGNHIGNLTISEGSQVVIRSGGLVNVKADSKLIIEEGGALIIEDGAIINLQGNESSIHIKEGGELIINGESKLNGNGFFQFDEGNILTLNADFLLNGKGKSNRFIRLNQNATLDIGDNRIRLAHGLVEYRNGSSIRIEEDGIVDLVHVSLNGLSSTAINNIGIESEHPQSMNLLDVDISNLSTGIEVAYNNNSTQPFLTPSFDINLCKFENCKVGVLGANEWDENTALELNISSSLFDGQENGQVGLWVIGFPSIEIQSSTFQNFKEESKGIQAENIHALKLSNTSVRDNNIGIYIPEGGNVLNQSNVFLFKGSEVKNNSTGILIEKGGISDSDNDFGMVTMDCAKLIDNQVGIQGTDVLLNIDACFNDGQFGTCDNSLVRPNVFINSLPTGQLFRICYEDRADIQEIQARGNYWSASGSSGLPNHFDHLLRSASSNLPCNGYSDVSLISDNNIFTLPQGCGNEVIVVLPTPGNEVSDNCNLDGGLSNESNCKFGEGSNSWSLNKRFLKAYLSFANDLEGKGMSDFQGLASIPYNERNNFCPPCRHYIDVARVMAHKEKGEKGLVSEETNSEVYKANAAFKHFDGVKVFPNPVYDRFELEWKDVVYDLRIYDMYGKLVYFSENNSKINLDIEDWSSGIYILELKDISSWRSVKKKIVLQRL